MRIDVQFPQIWQQIRLIVLAIVLAGCAAQNAYREGKHLAENGQEPEAIKKLALAKELDPNSVEYRLTFHQVRDRYIQSLLAGARQAENAGQYDQADSSYRRILAVQDNHQQALNGLQQVSTMRRWSDLVRSAEQALQNKDYIGANKLLRAVLSENPTHAVALKLMVQIDRDAPKAKTTNVLSSAYQQPITIEFKDVPLKSIFEVISRTSGLNFVLDREVRAEQQTSVFLKNASVDSAINLVLFTNQLSQLILNPNTVLIYPNTPTKQKEYQLLTVKAFYLSNANPKVVSETLKALLKLKDIVVDDKQNLLIVRDSPEAIRLAENLVALHDIPEAEAMLEVEVIEVSRSRLIDLGIQWPGSVSLTPVTTGTGTTLTLNALKNLNGDTINASVGATTINANKTDTDANILANPRIRTRNRETARILIGEKVPNITTTLTATGFSSESITYVDVGLKLEVEPTIFPGDEVSIKLGLEVSNINQQVRTNSGSLAYQIGTRTAQTTLRLKDGENQILAGLINDEDRSTANKFPGLGDIPLVGRLFGRTADNARKTEIVLSITPRIVRRASRPNAEILEFFSGTEANLAVPAFTSNGVPTPMPTTKQSPPLPVPTNPEQLPQKKETVPTGGSAAMRSRPVPVDQVQPTALPVAAPDIVPATTGTNNSGGEIGSAASVQLNGPSEIRKNTETIIQISINSAQPIVSLPMAISFDPKLIQVLAVEEGDFLRKDGAAASFSSRVDPSGRILISGTRSGATGASGAGVIAQLKLKGLSATDTRAVLEMINASPVALGGNAVRLHSQPSWSVKIAQ